MLNGTYVAVEPYNLDRYLDEQILRFNNRINMNGGDRFQKPLSHVGGKGITLIISKASQLSGLASYIFTIVSI
jgi:hypothetical protein